MNLKSNFSIRIYKKMIHILGLINKTSQIDKRLNFKQYLNIKTPINFRMLSKSKIILQGDLPIDVIKDGSGYSAFCSTINLASQGETIEESIKMFAESFTLLVEDLIETDNLEKFFLESGWKVEIQSSNSPVKIIIPPQILHTSIPLKDLMNA
jgi:predicted RNase H-like HicB family nuclease